MHVFIAAAMALSMLVAPAPDSFCGHHHTLCTPPKCSNIAYANAHPDVCPVTP